jgi:uncharacterized RDD family membrane protein YckC
MNQQFYIEVNGQQTGPFTLENLKTKNIQRDTLVWTDGLSNWTKAEQISGLQSLIQVSPPPLPNSATRTQPPPPRIPIGSATQTHFGYVLAGGGERFFASIINGLALLIVLLILDTILFNGSITDNITNNNSHSWRNETIGIIISGITGLLFYPMWCGNIGHKVVGIKVISSVDGSDCNKAGEGFIREILKNILAWFFIPVIWLLWDNDKQNLYDKISKTLVVRK